MMVMVTLPMTMLVLRPAAATDDNGDDAAAAASSVLSELIPQSVQFSHLSERHGRGNLALLLRHSAYGDLSLWILWLITTHSPETATQIHPHIPHRLRINW